MWSNWTVLCFRPGHTPQGTRGVLCGSPGTSPRPRGPWSETPPQCTGQWSEGALVHLQTHRAMVKDTALIRKDTQGSAQWAPRHVARGHRVVDLPGAQPHCCGGSSQSGRQAYSLLHPRTPETPSHQTRCPRCSHPISSRGLESPGDGCCIRRWQRSPPRRSVSLRRPLRRRQWRARRRTPGWLWRKA